MVKLNKIYTRTGDAGQTGLGDGARVSKTDLRVAAYGEVDEANAAIGLATAAAQDATLRETLTGLQQDLFDVGADLCVPRSSDEPSGTRLRVTRAQIERLEKLIDEHNADLTPLNSFVLPGGSELAARLHVARTIVRRAERAVVALGAAEAEKVGAEPAAYLNRLSDLLFVLARGANDAGRADVLWRPGANR